MDVFVVLYRLIAVLIIVSWVVQIAMTLGKPAEWRPRGADQSPIRITRRRYLAAGILGVIAGFAILVFSFVYFD